MYLFKRENILIANTEIRRVSYDRHINRGQTSTVL